MPGFVYTPGGESFCEEDYVSVGQSLSQVFISEILGFGRIESFITAVPSTGSSQPWSSVWICGINGLISDSRYVGKHSVHGPYDPSSGTRVLQTRKQIFSCL